MAFRIGGPGLVVIENRSEEILAPLRCAPRIGAPWRGVGVYGRVRCGCAFWCHVIE